MDCASQQQSAMSQRQQLQEEDGLLGFEARGGAPLGDAEHNVKSMRSAAHWWWLEYDNTLFSLKLFATLLEDPTTGPRLRRFMTTSPVRNRDRMSLKQLSQRFGVFTDRPLSCDGVPGNTLHGC